MDEIELNVYSLSSILQPADAYALVLSEVNGDRKLPVIIGSQEMQAIKVALTQYKVPRPLTHDLMVTMLKYLKGELKKVLIYKVKEGVFYAYLYLTNGEEEWQIDARTSDAIALAMRCGCPIFTTQEILENEHLHDVKENGFSVSVNVVDIHLLKESLEKAIEEENYEQASRLRDEIQRRERNQEQTPNEE